MNYILFEYWNDTDLGETLYQFGYHGKIFLNVEIEKPEYNTTIEAEQNGDNAEITKFRKWEKVRKFEIYMQEDLLDAFSFMAIHDNIEVTLRSGEVLTVQKHTMRVEPTWEEIGCLAKVNISFVVDYVTAGSCQTNMDLGCLCEDVSGAFNYIVEYSALAGEPDGTIVLAWTVEGIAGKQYTAKRYQFSYLHNTWVELLTDQNACYTNTADSTTWIYDGQFWQLFPGYIIALSQPDLFTTEILVKGYVIPGAFGSIYYSYNGGAFVDSGDYSADNLAIGITINGGLTGDYDIKLKVWNHSCDYGYTETGGISVV